MAKHQTSRKGLKLYTLTKANGDVIKVNAQQIADQVGITLGTAHRRLYYTTKYEIAFAKKGEVVGHKYSKVANTARQVDKKKYDVGGNQSKKRKENYIKENKPFYVDTFYRSMLKIINATPRRAA